MGMSFSSFVLDLMSLNLTRSLLDLTSLPETGKRTSQSWWVDSISLWMLQMVALESLTCSDVCNYFAAKLVGLRRDWLQLSIHSTVSDLDRLLKGLMKRESWSAIKVEVRVVVTVLSLSTYSTWIESDKSSSCYCTNPELSVISEC